MLADLLVESLVLYVSFVSDLSQTPGNTTIQPAALHGPPPRSNGGGGSNPIIHNNINTGGTESGNNLPISTGSDGAANLNQDTGTVPNTPTDNPVTGAENGVGTSPAQSSENGSPPNLSTDETTTHLPSSPSSQVEENIPIRSDRLDDSKDNNSGLNETTRDDNTKIPVRNDSSEYSNVKNETSTESTVTPVVTDTPPSSTGSGTPTDELGPDKKPLEVTPTVPPPEVLLKLSVGDQSRCIGKPLELPSGWSKVKMVDRSSYQIPSTDAFLWNDSADSSPWTII